MTGRCERSPWLANAWVVAFAAPFFGAALLSPDAFVAVIQWLYLRLPIHGAVFRAELAVQTRILHSLCGPAAVVATGAWALASARGVFLARAVTGQRDDESASETWRRRLVALLLLYSIALAPVRLVRDGLREAELAGLGFAERRLHVYGRHSSEPDYRAIEAFQRSSGDAGALLVLRTGRFFDFADGFAASYLFPRRVYVAHAPRCSAAAAALLAASRPDVRWLQLSCERGAFAPRPFGSP